MTRWAYAAIALVALTFVGNAVVAAQFNHLLPERVPIHWNALGQPDGWAGRDSWFTLYFLFPTITGIVVALALVLPWVSPKNFEVAEFRGVYDYVLTLIAGLFAAMNAIFLAAQHSGDGRLSDRWLLALLFAFFAALGQVLAKVRPNFWMGIRTPWTLASPRVWDETHRVGAWLFVAMGVVGAAAALAGAPFGVLIGFLLAGSFAPVIYSLVLYKRLQARGEV